MCKILARLVPVVVTCTLMLTAVPSLAQPQGTPFIVLARDADDPDEALIQWSALPDVTHYQVILGDLDDLLENDGDFTQAADECLEEELPVTVASAIDVPNEGEAFWFLVRAVNDDGNGTWDSLSASQQGQRDAEVDEAGRCP